MPDNISMTSPHHNDNVFNDNETPAMEIMQLAVDINNKTICNNLNLQIRAGETWAIMGINGAGKTTLLHSLAGLRPVKSGTVTINDKPMSGYSRMDIARQRGILLQSNPDAFPATVLETVLTGRHPYLHNWQWESATDIDIANHALTNVGLDGMQSRLTNTLSGGEYRRTCLAALLAQDPAMYFLDEPTNHLDLHQQISILDLFQSFTRNRQKAVVMILHDINLVQRYCDHCLMLLPEGETICGKTHDVLNEKILSRMLNHTTKKIDTPGGPVFLPE